MSEDEVAMNRLLARCILTSNECMEWLGAIDPNGYGVSTFQKKKIHCHRLMFLLYYNEVPDVVCHTCDNRKCFNPHHLFAGTHRDNMADMVAKGRQYRPTADKHHNRKLSSDKVKEIRRLRKQGVKGVTLAGQFGVSQQTISLVCNGSRWPTVE